MYAVLRANITLGDYIFKQINEVVIDRSVDTLSDTATIKMPTSFLLGNEDKGFTRQKLDKAIKPGDEVVIVLMYEGIIEKQEFMGYVKKIKPTIPMEIECEDAIYLIRKRKLNKLFVNAKLVDVLEYIVAGTGVKLSTVIPAMQLDRFLLKDVNGAKALQTIKEEFGLAIYIDDDGKLFAGLKQQLNAINKVEYHFQRNVISNDLEFTNEEDVSLRVKAIGIAPDNTRITVEVGDTEGEERTLHFYNISDKAKLTELANAELLKLKYTGYKGSLTSFLEPDCDRGWSADIVDGNYPEKSGTYFVESTQVTYSDAGARRVVTLGVKL